MDLKKQKEQVIIRNNGKQAMIDLHTSFNRCVGMTLDDRVRNHLLEDDKSPFSHFAVLSFHFRI